MPAFYKEWFWKSKLALMSRVLLKPQPRALVYAGAGSTGQLCATISQFGLRNILLVTDRPLVELGVVNIAVDALHRHAVETTIYDGVLPDPTLQVADDGLAVLRRHNCDGVLAFGGGSSIDCAKVIALAAGNNCQAADCIGLNNYKLPALPFFAAPTTAGTGSEGTFIAVISDNDTHRKAAVLGAALIPRATALDPQLMTSLPPHITAATGMDALTHAIESYIGLWETGETGFYGLTACKLIFENLETACGDGENLSARQAMALASYYGGLAITNTLVGYVHAVSHNLGAKYGIAHGLGNAMVLPHVLELMRDAAAEKMADIAVHCGFGERDEDNTALAQKLIERVRALNEATGIPKQTDVIRAEDVDELVDLALAEGSGYPTPRYLERAEAVALINKLRAA